MAILTLDDVRRESAGLKFTALVYFRGAWCPWCQAYAASVEKVRAELEAAGGRVYLVTSQSAAGIEKLPAEWAFKGAYVSDPGNEFARKHGVEVADKAPVDVPGEYAAGMAQPAFLVFSDLDAAEPDLYRWSIRASDKNLNAAKDRPLPGDVKDVVLGRRAGDSVRFYGGAELKAEAPHLFAAVKGYYEANAPAFAEELKRDVAAAAATAQ